MYVVAATTIILLRHMAIIHALSEHYSPPLINILHPQKLYKDEIKIACDLLIIPLYNTTTILWSRTLSLSAAVMLA